MKPKTLMLLVVAVGCGLVAMLGVQQAMNSNKAAPAIERKSVLVALEHIEMGQTLVPSKVVFRPLPVDSLPPAEDLIVTPEEYEERGARVPLFAGDVITKSKLTEPGGTGNSIKITKGMRVITIPVTENESHSNLISPGDRVDVLVTYKSGGGGRGGSTKTKTLLEYVEVFATDAKTSDKIKGAEEKSSKTSHVSLLLMPEQVNYVKLAESKGKLSLSWRHKLDDEFVQIRDIDEALLEELEGTIGINDHLPLYANQELNTFEPTEPKFNFEQQTESPQAMLDSLETEVVQQQVAVVEAKPQWQVRIFNGRNQSVQGFEIEEVEVKEVTTQIESTANPFAETVRSLFKRSN